MGVRCFTRMALSPLGESALPRGMLSDVRIRQGPGRGELPVPGLGMPCNAALSIPATELTEKALPDQPGVSEGLPGGFLRLRLSSGSIPLPSQEFSGLILVNLRDETPPPTGQQPCEEPAGIARAAPTGVHGQTHEPQLARLAPLGEPSLARLMVQRQGAFAVDQVRAVDITKRWSQMNLRWVLPDTSRSAPGGVLVCVLPKGMLV